MPESLLLDRLPWFARCGTRPPRKRLLNSVRCPIGLCGDMGLCGDIGLCEELFCLADALRCDSVCNVTIQLTCQLLRLEQSSMQTTAQGTGGD